jgi:ATP-binding cassette, subfamily B, bacterial
LSANHRSSENTSHQEAITKPYLYLLKKYLRPMGWLVLLLAVLLLGSIGLQLVNPQIMRRFIDLLAQGEFTTATSEELLQIGILFFGIAVVQQALGVFATYLSEYIGWAATNTLRFDLAQHCLKLDMSFHNAHTPGEMIERIDGDVGALSYFFSQFLVRLVTNILLLAGMLFLLYWEDWRVGLALTGFTFVAMFTLWRLRNIAVPHWKARRQASAEFNGFLEERLSGTEDIRANGAQAYVMNRFYGFIQVLMNKSLAAGLMNNVLMNSTQVLFAIGNAVAFAVGAWLYLENALTIGAVYVIFHYSTMLAGPIQGLTSEAQNLQYAGGSVERLIALFQTKSKIQGWIGAAVPLPDKILKPGALAVAFQDVSFGYDLATRDGVAMTPHLADEPFSANGGTANGKTNVLQGISFQLQPGRALGLLGRTGSGKTTLARLLFRMYDPDRGAICLGAGDRLVDIRQIPLGEVRQAIGLVTQNVQLFNATIYDNLTFFDRSVPEAQIRDVLRDLGLWKWFQALPHGLETKLGTGGGGLSAGQAQLLAFARVFLQNPGLVILDEASSRLDPATEHLLERAVDELLNNRTAIIIAHRLSTVQRVDEIMVMENGCIEEYGQRLNLVQDPRSSFSRLLQTGLEGVLA